MALIECPECGKDVSDQATACPSCAYPIKNRGCCVELDLTSRCEVIICDSAISSQVER